MSFVTVWVEIDMERKSELRADERGQVHCYFPLVSLSRTFSTCQKPQASSAPGAVKGLAEPIPKPWEMFVCRLCTPTCRLAFITKYPCPQMSLLSAPPRHLP
jgi:hypothetical protein